MEKSLYFRSSRFLKDLYTPIFFKAAFQDTDVKGIYLLTDGKPVSLTFMYINIQQRFYSKFRFVCSCKLGGREGVKWNQGVDYFLAGTM